MRTHSMVTSERVLDESTKTSWDYSDDAELVSVSSGSVRVLSSDGFQIFTLREGEGVLIPPKVMASLLPASRSAKIHSIIFPLSLLWGDTSSVIYEKYAQPISELSGPLSLSPKAAGLAEKAYETLLQRSYCYELEARDFLSSALIIVLRELEGEEKKEKIFEDERLHRMITFIKEHYSEDISLSDIASSGNVSERECLRAFSRTLGTSPVQYLISSRLAESRKLLQMTDLSIGEVAYRTGFSTPAHFSRSFREDSGYSPTQWRRKL